MNQNSLNIIGKHDKINVKNFDNLEQFNDYYKLHENEINKLSTVKLNRMYHIKDYKIVRRKIDNDKTLCFQQVFKNEDSHESTINNIDELLNRIKALELDNVKIKQQLMEIINVINSQN